MKKLLLAALLLSRLGGCTTTLEPEQYNGGSALPIQQGLVRVQGSAASFNISTFLAVSCSAYGRQFGGDRPIDIADEQTLTRIGQRLDKLQVAPSGDGVDVRAKAVLFYTNHKQDTICLGKFTSYYRGRVVETDTMLLRLLGIKAN